MAEQDIVERLRGLADMRHMDRGHDQVDDAMREAASTIEAIAEEAERKGAEIASLRQQLAEARETARREALEEAAMLVHDARADLERQSGTTLNSVTHDALLLASDALELVGDEIRALPHPDREGERLSEAETAARIVDTQARYYAGHNEDIAKALREAAGAIRAQVRPGRGGERK